MKFINFEIILHLLIAGIFLSDFLKKDIPYVLYVFLKDNRDTVLGLYYIYLAYKIYISVNKE